MPLPTFWNTGTASVASGATTITFGGALLGTAALPNIKAGDMFLDPAQPLVPAQRIASVDYDAGTAELAVGWPGSTMAAAAYEVRYTSDISRSTAQSRRYLEMLGQLAALGIQPDAFGEFADRDAYDDAAGGFIFLSLEDPWTLYTKLSGDSADWSDGQAVEGPQGDAPGTQLTFSTTTTDSDPGAGNIRFNSGTFASIAWLYIDDADVHAVDIADILGALAANDLLRLQSPADGSVYAEFKVTGAPTVASGYHKVPVSPRAGAVPANGTAFAMTVSPANNYVVSDIAAGTLAAKLLGDDPQGVAINFAANGVFVKSLKTPASDFMGLPEDWLTFTRASTATRVNASGLLESVASGVMRLDFDPLTLEPRGFLCEEQRTNLLTYSEQFDNAAWTKTRASISANAVVAPDGASTADKMVEDTSNDTHLVEVIPTLSNSTDYIISVFAKAAEKSILTMWPADAGWTQSVVVSFDLATGTIPYNPGATESGMQNLGNGWWRCWTKRTTAASGTRRVRFMLTQDGSPAVVTYTGNGSSGLYVWGAQLEAGAFRTSYIPTVASQVTRAADSASVNISSLLSSVSGTLYVEGSINRVAASSATLAELGDGTTAERVLCYVDSDNTMIALIVDGGVSQASLDTAVSPAASASRKQAIAWALNDFAHVGNGGTPVTDASGSLPAMTTLYVGRTSGGFYLNGWIKKVAYFPRRLTNAELQALTA